MRKRKKSTILVAVLGVGWGPQGLTWTQLWPQTPECPSVGFSPYPNKGTLSLFLLAEETLARSQVGF